MKIKYIILFLTCLLLLSSFTAPATACCEPPAPPCHRCEDTVWVWDCGAGQICCNGTCCDSDDCCNDEICCNSGDTCCTDSGAGDAYCCAGGKTCCDKACCDPSTETCCDDIGGDNDGYCCNTGQECCEGECCDPDECEDCVGGSCQVCDGDPNKICCDGTCCDTDECYDCNSTTGECEWDCTTGQCCDDGECVDNCPDDECCDDGTCVSSCPAGEACCWFFGNVCGPECTQTARNSCPTTATLLCPPCFNFGWYCDDFKTTVYTGNQNYICSGDCPFPCIPVDDVHCWTEYGCINEEDLLASCVYDPLIGGDRCKAFPHGLSCYRCIQDPADPGEKHYKSSNKCLDQQ